MVKVTKKAFAVIGKEGSTLDGEGFIQKLWKDANDHFGEIAHLAKKGASGALVGIWGAMSDFSRSFQPWQAWNALTTQKLLMDGLNGQYPVMSISLWKTTRERLKKPLNK